MNIISCRDLSKHYAIYPSPRTYLKELIYFGKKKFYKNFVALEDINFEIPKGQTLGIIGRNGAGKSTLLKILAGTTRPTGGEINVFGKVAALLELGAGFHPEFSGRRNIILNGTIMGYTRQEIYNKFDDIVSFAELEEFIDLPIKTYSSGMIVRLGFSIAINTNPDILLIDEVLAVGDIAFQKKCIRKLNELRRLGKTILLVSHSLGDLGGFCDRVILLSEGRIMYDGNTEQVIKKYLAIMGQDISESSSDEYDMLGIESTKFEKRSKEIEIGKVSILDIKGNQVSSINTGEQLQIIIDYKVNQKMSNPLFRMGFYRSDGLFVMGTNTYRQNINFGTIKKDGRLAVIFDTVNLLQGLYYITIEICRNEYASSLSGSTIDCHNMAYQLDIKSPRSLGGGIAYIPNRWVILDYDNGRQQSGDGPEKSKIKID